ncbi:hypothetical protein T310_9322, partial [Rasamsonia emersonii CBS 393.64]
LVGAPGIADPDGGVAADPEGDERGVVFFGEFLEVDPWFAVREEMGVADDGEREWSRGLPGVSSLEHGVVVCMYTDHFKMQIQHPRIVDREHDQPCNNNRQDDIARPELSNCALQLHQREDVSESVDQHC